MLIDKIIIMVNSDHDEDFNIYEKNKKIFIELEGFQFKNKAKIIIIDNSKIIYEDKNKIINYNTSDQNDLLNYLYHTINNWINLNGPANKDNFKKIF